MKRSLPLILLFAALVACSMVGGWHSIAPPGECDACHRVPIGHDWTLGYRVVQLNDERGRLAWQQSQSLLPPAVTVQERLRLNDQRCFHCHQSPDRDHLERLGRYQHQ